MTFTQLPAIAKAMVCGEITTHQRDRIFETRESGEGYKNISTALDMPWKTLKAVIKKGRKYGTTVTLQRTGKKNKIDKKTRRKQRFCKEKWANIAVKMCYADGLLLKKTECCD